MLLIQDYLTAHGIAELHSTYAISAKRHGEFPNLVMFKYNQIESPMAEKIVQQCRGIILDEAHDWRVVSFPFTKFFNYGEPHANAIDWPSAKVYEKLDGSLMTLYWYANQWRVASSGTPDAGGHVDGCAGTFADLFWTTWKSCGYALPSDRGSCYLFELMTPYNRVVVPHTAGRIVFIGRREITPPYRELDAAAENAEPGWDCVCSYPLRSLDDCLTAASILKGIDGEGFVICDRHFNRIKVKAPQYVALAHMKESMSERRMLDVIRAGESDEFLTYFPEMRPTYDAIRLRFDELCASVETDYAQIKHHVSQKDFAMAAKETRCSSAVFAIRNGKAQTARGFFAAATQQAVERAIGGLRHPSTESVQE